MLLQEHTCCGRRNSSEDLHLLHYTNVGPYIFVHYNWFSARGCARKTF
ncbi:unnamed protein product [Amoebophrya sp. A120]|nr:unnamed protein product [Amoebophrya sp. A120]|eukprot:GSA120T00007299001.1